MRRAGWSRTSAFVNTPQEEVCEVAIAPKKPVVPSRSVITRIDGLHAAAIVKTKRHRSPNLLAMAKDRPCLIEKDGECIGGTETTVACHSNSSAHGKAGARKADDEYSVWGCFGCHTWLDRSGNATSDEKTSKFDAAHIRQVEEWLRISNDSSEPEKWKKAAQWALSHLEIASVISGSKRLLIK